MIFRQPGDHALLEGWDLPVASSTPLATNCAYEDNATRRLSENLGMVQVVPPKVKRKAKWDYHREFYNLRNEIERLF